MKIIRNSAFGIVVLFLGACSESQDSRAIKLNQAGLVYQYSMQMDSALAKFKAAAALGHVSDQVQATLLRNIAICYSEMDQYDSAKLYYQKAILQLPPKSYAHLVNKADVYVLDGAYEKAIDILDSAITLDSDRLEANNTLGLLYLGEYEEEYYDPQKALRYNLKANAVNNDRSTQFVLGKNYYQLKRFPEAIQIFTSLYNKYPDYSNYLYSLILIHEEAGNTKHAENLLEELKQADPVLYEEYLELNVAD